MDGKRIATEPVSRRAVLAMCAGAFTLGLTGCDVVSDLTTPTLDELETESAEASLASPTILADGVLAVGLDTSDAPQAMTNSDGEYVGYAIDVALAIAGRLGLSVRVVDAASAAVSVGDGEADIYIGTDADNVGSDYAATGVYLEDATALFAATGTADSGLSVESFDETVVVGVQDASASQDALVKAGIAATQQTYSNVNECFEALDSGEVSYVACDATAGAYLARMYTGIDFVATISSTSSFCITSLASNEELSEAIADALDDIDTDGTLSALHAIWYGDLPESLSDTLLSGITITDSEGDTTTGSSASSDDTDDELQISGDINSID